MPDGSRYTLRESVTTRKRSSGLRRAKDDVWLQLQRNKVSSVVSACNIPICSFQEQQQQQQFGDPCMLQTASCYSMGSTMVAVLQRKNDQHQHLTAVLGLLSSMHACSLPLPAATYRSPFSYAATSAACCVDLSPTALTRAAWLELNVLCFCCHRYLPAVSRSCRRSGPLSRQATGGGAGG